ncbi:hypothetical protein PsorP6_001559 [Peronosclerospora sorghi]|uniref:Uncharacterized protein n=1 Tax=Peronosclerospora sorghi TaxID=230839 RepID=A0ACC0WVT2_9STRA|nr:hypothetical protein PsorP6_001559 [Peronosclerospora sorghi]
MTSGTWSYPPPPSAWNYSRTSTSVTGSRKLRNRPRNLDMTLGALLLGVVDALARGTLQCEFLAQHLEEQIQKRYKSTNVARVRAEDSFERPCCKSIARNKHILKSTSAAFDLLHARRNVFKRVEAQETDVKTIAAQLNKQPEGVRYATCDETTRCLLHQLASRRSKGPKRSHSRASYARHQNVPTCRENYEVLAAYLLIENPAT